MSCERKPGVPPVTSHLAYVNSPVRAFGSCPPLGGVSEFTWLSIPDRSIIYRQSLAFTLHGKVRVEHGTTSSRLTCESRDPSQQRHVILLLSRDPVSTVRWP